MADKRQPIPEGRPGVIPHLVVKGAAEAIEFYVRAFGAVEVFRMPMPDGEGIVHAELQLGDCRIFITDEFPQWGSTAPETLGGSPVVLHLQVADIDRSFERAVAAGAEPTMPPADMFWGDRYGKLRDPFGHEWAMATHVRDVPLEEMAEAMKQAMAAPGEA